MMNPQEHSEAIWPQDEPLSYHPEDSPSWQMRSRLFRGVGVALPLVVSFVCAFIDLSLLLLWIPFFLGVASGALLRSWWSIFIVPAAFSIGLVLSSLFLGSGVFLSSMTNPVFAGPPAYTFLMVFGIPSLIIGTAITTPISRKIERLLQTPGPST